jgi:hypothetical protein
LGLLGDHPDEDVPAQLVISLWTARRLDPHANEKDPEVELRALFPATKGSNGLVQLASWRGLGPYLSASAAVSFLHT